MKNYSSHNTAILIVDPFNDFLSEGGKLWSKTKETVKGINLIENLKNILPTARSSGIKIVYVPHRQTEKGDYSDWKFLAPSHEGSLKYSLFEKGSWVENNSILNSRPTREILSRRIIGRVVALQIQILIFC